MSRNVCDDCLSFARCPLIKGRETCGLHTPVPALFKQFYPDEAPLGSVREAFARHGVECPDDGGEPCA